MKKLMIAGAALGAFFATTTRIRRRMAWNCLRGRSVCYRMNIGRNGFKPQTEHAIVAYNVMDMGLWNESADGITLDVFA